MKLLARSSQETLSRIDELLEAKYRSADLGNLDDPLAEAIYLLLSKQTRQSVYQKLFSELRCRYPQWTDLLSARRKEVERILEPGGLSKQRSVQIKSLLAVVMKANYERGIGPADEPPTDLTLDFLREMNAADAEQFLIKLPGIGPKTARCIMAYSLDLPSFGVDTHVHRAFSRLQLLDSAGRKRDHDPFQDAVPPEMRKRLHMNLIHHGRAVCRTRKPACCECILVSFCSTGRQAVSSDQSRPVAVDLFAGAGGLGYGFRSAGFRVALAVESDRNAAQTYRFNNPGVPVVEAEINNKTTGKLLRTYMPGVSKISALLAGPPCQGYSVAGARKPDHPANLLYRHVARLASELRVQAVCLENVPGVRRVNGHGFLSKITNELEGAGFNVVAHLLHACDFGVPQHRARYFFLGIRGKNVCVIAKPEPTHRSCHQDHTDMRQTTMPMTPRLDDLLAVLPEIPSGVLAEQYLDSDGRRYCNLSTMRHSNSVIRKISSISPGAGPISYRRLDCIEATTLIAGHRAMPVHPRLDRTISVREAALIQGFPLDYFFCGSRSTQPLQVANAVPPPVAEAVAKEILKGIGIDQETIHRGTRSKPRVRSSDDGVGRRND